MSNVFDIRSGRPAVVPSEKGRAVAQYLETWKQQAAEAGIQSMLVVSVDETSNVKWDIKTDNMQHLMQMYIELDTLKSVILELLYPEYELVEDDEG